MHSSPTHLGPVLLVLLGPVSLQGLGPTAARKQAEATWRQRPATLEPGDQKQHVIPAFLPTRQSVVARPHGGQHAGR